MSRFQCYRTSEAQVRWRLLGGNNRVLGVGLTAHPDYRSALGAIALVRAGAADAAFQIEHRPADGRWWWHLRLSGDGEVAARSVQGFARRIEAFRAAERFRRQVETAVTDPVLAIFQPGQRGQAVRRYLPNSASA